MKFLPMILLVGLGLTGCKKDSDASPTPIGNWKLISRQCFCTPASVLNQTASFSKSTFAFYRNGQLTAQGSYGAGKGQICGGTDIPVTKFRYDSPAPSILTDVIITVTGNTLRLDYGGACDAPLEIYERLQ